MCADTGTSPKRYYKKPCNHSRPTHARTSKWGTVLRRSFVAPALKMDPMRNILNRNQVLPFLFFHGTTESPTSPTSPVGLQKVPGAWLSFMLSQKSLVSNSNSNTKGKLELYCKVPNNPVFVFQYFRWPQVAPSGLVSLFLKILYHQIHQLFLEN